jgi:general secretion pathway protein A
MYQEFFHLRKSPFGMNPDPGCLFMTASHREAFASLLYAISSRKGFVVLTGDAGTGKTSLLRALIRVAESATFSVILTPTLSTDEFLELALLDFGVVDPPASKAQRIVKLQELLLEMRLNGKAPVLMVDEAHKLQPEVLEEIRFLTNFETTEQKLLQIVLAGQNDLTDVLNRQDLRQLKQRIEVRMTLKPLAAGDIAGYMHYRWTHAGGETSFPFSSGAVALIGSASRGIPRVVNAICDNALLLAYAGGEQKIGTAHIRQVLLDLDISELEATVESNGIGPKLAGVNGVTSNGESMRHPAPHLRINSSIAPRSFLALEQDESPQKPSLLMRWADKMNFGGPQVRRDKP